MLFVLNMSTHADDFQWPGLSAQESRLYRDLPKIFFKILSQTNVFVTTGIHQDVDYMALRISEILSKV